jgi:zinc protease
MRPLHSLLTLALLTASLAATAAKPPSDYRQLKYPPMHPLQVPEPVRFELSNGLIVYLVEDHELPTIDLQALIRVGSRWEPVEKAGLADITGTVMRTGGTPTRSGDALDEELDRLGATVEIHVGDDSGVASVSVLKEDFDRGLEILVDLLQHPAFPESKIELAKLTERDSIARRNEDPGSVISREFERIIFGPASAYAHQPEYDTIQAITRADLVAFHQEYFQPESVVLGAWGDFKSSEMRAKLERALGAWPRGGHPRPAVPAVEAGAAKRGGVYVIDKEDVNQSNVMLGHLGGQRNDPDYYALAIMSRILGGGFGSRLFNHVRSAQGLAYSVYSAWSGGWDRPGLFLASGGTKSATTVKIVQSIKAELASMTAAEPTDDELARTKDGILKGFAFEFDSVGKIVQRMLSYEYYGYPRDYLQRFRENIAKVTKADVLRVARQHLKLEDLAVVVLGKVKDFEQPPTVLGPVAMVDITIPPPKTEKLAAATPETADKARKLLAAAREAMGGAALRALKNHSIKMDIALSTPGGDAQIKLETTLEPGVRVVTRMEGPFGDITQGFDGQAAWQRSAQGTQDLAGTEREEVVGSVYRDTLGLIRSFDAPGFSAQALGSAELEGKPVEWVAISDPAHQVQVKFALDAQTHLPLKKSYRALLMGAPSDMDEVFSDYREAAGLKLPFKAQLIANGQKLGEGKLTEFKANTELKPEAFRKP